MKKYLSKILISVIMVAIFMAPVSGGIKINDKQKFALGVEMNEARAEDPTGVCTDPSSNTTFPQKMTEKDCKTLGSTYKWAANSNYFDCSGILPWNDIACKTASLLYFAIFTPMAAFTWLSAKLLDFFVYYSTNNTSYNGDFVTKAWGAVRDIANIFFIIALLYVAIKTILGLNVTDNKKLISAIIVVALVINFSLFTTKVVIDGSNILAKVFYNNITSVDETGKALEAGKGGQKSVSVGLVKQFDPQTIFVDSFKGHEGLFIFVTLLSILLMGFMIYIFLSVMLLFVARVVSLWLSMIFSPIAFISYTLPFDIPGFGHKEWWKNLFESAFLAPIFIFFLYIIILFGNAMKNIPYDVSSTADDIGGYLDAAMKTIIPFVIIFILLQMAKKLAITYSGKMGEAVGKVGSMIGGAAVGGIVGGTALLGRQTIGRVASNISEKEGFKNWAAESKFGATTLKMTRGIGAGSFDARGIKVGGMGLPSTLGKAQAGGFTGARAAAVKRQEEFANKTLDTSNYGIAQMTKGGMTVDQANKVIDQMVSGGMGITEAFGHQEALVGRGMTLSDAKTAALHLSQARRGVLSDRLKDSRFMTNRIAANKVRKDAKTLKEEAGLQHALEHIAHEIAPHGEAHEEKTHKEEKHEEAHPAPVAHTPTPAAHPEGGSEHKH